MKAVTYTGVHLNVVVPTQSGLVYECDRDGSVDLPDQLADELLKRDDWQLTKTSNTTNKSAKDKE